MLQLTFNPGLKLTGFQTTRRPWRPRNDALSLLHLEELGLRMERKNSLVNAKSNMAEEESFEVRKQLLLTSYFEISSTEELKNYLAN